MKKFDFLKKVVFPLMAAALSVALFYPLCVENGVCDYRKLWILAGIPFGVHQMFVWAIPKGFDLGGTAGMLVFNLPVGGVIGGFALVWNVTRAVFYLLCGIAAVSRWRTGKIAGRQK